MSVEKNKAIVRRWNEEIIAGQKIDAFDEVLHDEYENHGRARGGPWATMIKGLDDAKKKFAEVFQKRPTWKPKIEDVIGEGDKVAARVTLYENGVPISQLIAYYRLSGGKIIDDWYVNKRIEQE